MEIYRYANLLRTMQNNLLEAEEKLNEFERMPEVKHPIHWHYYCSMRALKLKMEGSNRVQIAEYLKEALASVVVGYDTDGYKRMRLAPMEIDTLLEWYYARAERCEKEFEELINYCKENIYNESQKCRVLPKIVLYAYYVAKEEKPIRDWTIMKVIGYLQLLEYFKQTYGLDYKMKADYLDVNRYILALENMYRHMGMKKEMSINFSAYVMRGGSYYEEFRSMARRVKKRQGELRV